MQFKPNPLWGKLVLSENKHCPTAIGIALHGCPPKSTELLQFTTVVNTSPVVGFGPFWNNEFQEASNSLYVFSFSYAPAV